MRGRSEAPARKRSDVERRVVVEHGLNHVQRALMVVVVGAVAADFFNALRRVAHGKRVFHQLQHLGIVAAVANADALLWGDFPAFQQAANAVGFVQAWDESNPQNQSRW